MNNTATLYRCVAAIPNNGGKCIEHFYEDNANGRRSAEDFARQYDKPGWGVYDCVSPLRLPKRTKENVAQIEGLHADIDIYKTNRIKDEVIQQLQDQFAHAGILSQINSSGRGIHVHFLFKDPIEAGAPEVEKAQQVLKRLTAHLGADPHPAHFAALMRRMGTTNSKEGGGPCKPLIITGERCDLSDIEAYLELSGDSEPLFPETNPSNGDKQNDGPVDADARLAAMKHKGENGTDVNTTLKAVIPALIWKAWHPTEIFERVFGALKIMVERDNLKWDMAAEEAQTCKRIVSAYKNLFDEEYDPASGEIPIWVPMEFHEAWAAALAAGKRPVISRNATGWHVRAYEMNGAKEKDDATHPEADPPKQDDPSKPFVLRLRAPFDPANIPPREFLFGKHYQRRTVGGTIAPGGTGKSSLQLVEFISMAVGLDLLNNKQPLPQALRAWYHNGEDNMDELDRRVAAICQHYELSLKNLLTGGNFFYTSGNEVPLRVAQNATELRLQFNNGLIKCITEQICANKIDAAGFDPLVTLHAVSEKDPGKMDSVVRIFSQIADERHCAIDLSHHTRKTPPGIDISLDIDDARGVKAITDAMRAVRLLNYMSKEDAQDAGLLELERMSYFRIDRGKANYSAPSNVAVWRKFVSVILPNGDDVGVVAAWEYPGQDGRPSERRQTAKHLFLEILRKTAQEGRFYGERGPYNAPSVFAREREAKLAKIGKTALAQAMRDLFDEKKIRLEEYDKGDRHSGKRIVEV